MFKRSLILLSLIILVFAVIIGCSSGVKKPGTGGTGSAQKIDAAHPEIPAGVKCYVCHKREIPQNEFHKQYNTNCEDCHGTATWMAYKYPHEKWELGVHRKMQCTRCHAKMKDYNFEWQCWGCHHEEKATAEFHKAKGIDDITNCIMCHKGSKKTE